MFNSPSTFDVSVILAPVAPNVTSPSEALGPLGASVFPHFSPQHAPFTATSHDISSPAPCGE